MFGYYNNWISKCQSKKKKRELVLQLTIYTQKTDCRPKWKIENITFLKENIGEYLSDHRLGKKFLGVKYKHFYSMKGTVRKYKTKPIKKIIGNHLIKDLHV